MLDDSIILAVASPPGRAARGLVRLSGAGSFDLLPRLAQGCGDASRGARPVRLRLSPSDGGAELPCLALHFPGPASYTGEDVIELFLPGNPVLLERVIDALLDAADGVGLAARRAGPGEFTARAFLNGRLSLTQAEGVAASIAARSDAELRAAALLTGGELGNFARSLADDLADALALVEAGIDFTDQEDVIVMAPADLLGRLTDIGGRLRARLDRAVGFESLQAIPWVVLAGAPNAGKSTLFNALLGRPRAVTSALAGTTRDVLVEPIVVSRQPSTISRQPEAEVMLVDVAGLDDAAGSFLDAAMRDAARQAIDRAELVLLCVPGDAPTPGAEALRWIDPADPRVLMVRTKADAGRGQPSSRSHQPSAVAQPRTADHWESTTGHGPISVSAHTGEGLEALRVAIAERLAGRAVSLAADALALQPRHESGLRAALASIEEAAALLAPRKQERALAAPELIAACLRSALDDLAEVAGDITPDDVLGRIFGRFCVGK